jgi:uncharacterized repeat protein (TIGR01451 family)
MFTFHWFERNGNGHSQQRGAARFHVERALSSFANLRGWLLPAALILVSGGMFAAPAAQDKPTAEPPAEVHSGFRERPADVDKQAWVGLRTLVENAKLKPADGAAYDFFGWSVSLSGDRALVGAYQDDDNGSESGAAYVFDFNGTSWSETAKLKPADGAAGDYFGTSVSLVDDRALVASIRDDDNGDRSGSAYVFDFDGTSWSETAKLKSTDGAAGDYFGTSVSLSGDRALVGANGDDDNGTSSGSAYVFEFNGTAWYETGKLKPTDGAASDYFGGSVSLWGDRALVGANDDHNGNDSGAAYVFELNGTTWSEAAKLTPTDGAEFDYFGNSVSLADDRALVGAWWDDDNGNRSGSAYVFDFGGTTWSETAKLTPTDGAASDEFGFAVSLSGNRALVGAIGDDDNGSSSGSAYVFELSGSTWNQTAKLTASDGAEGNSFGFAVSLSDDRALFGARGDDDNGGSSGSAYVFADNQPPTAVPDAVSTDEDTPLSGNVLADNGSGLDSDPDGDPLAVTTTPTSGPDHGGLTLDASGAFDYTPNADFNGPDSFEYKVCAPSPACDTTTVSITVEPVNDPPALSAGDPAAVVEDAGAQSIAGWPGFDPGAANESAQSPLTYTVSDIANPALFSAGPAVDTSGNLTYTPAADAFGTSTFDVAVQDDGGTANGGADTSPPETFTITVEPVNDPPTFTPGGDVETLEDTTFDDAWAGNLSTGPGESGQSLSFQVDNDNSALFAEKPAIDANGNLTFTPAAGATGTATATAVLVDDGSTGNGGNDESAPATFEIAVNAGADIQVDKSVEVESMQTGALLTYTVVVSNLGPSDVNGVVVLDVPPSSLDSVTWTCTAEGAASCGAANGKGGVNLSANIPKGDHVAVLLEGTILEITSEEITNTAVASVPAHIIEINSANNTDTATIAIGIFADRFEG